MESAHGAEGILRDLVVIFGVSVAVIVAFSRLRLPAIAGLLVAGVVLGPHVTGLVPDSGVVEVLAEVGVVLLLFTLGLEFSLARLKSIWRLVVFGGSLQVGLTAASTAGVAVLLGLGGPQAIAAGFLVALSSTAIVLRALSERREVETLHGRLIVGMLIFQDLCVVPMMLAIPVLAGGEASAGEIAAVLGKAVVVVLGVVAAARVFAPRVLGIVARARSREAFVMATVVLCLGIAWLTSLTGLSLALGAFLAGLVVSETEYGHQAMSDVLPFRDSLMALFFVSVGMLLDLGFLRDHGLEVAGLTAGILFLKTVLAAVSAMVLRFPTRVAVLAGVSLSQVGEFSLVLAGAGKAAGLLDDRFLGAMLNAAVLTMLLTPLLVRLSPHIATTMGLLRRLERLVGYRGIEDAPPDRKEFSGHVIVGGYGVGGRLVAKGLRRCGIPFLVLELNPENVREGREAGDPVWYGDVSAREVLHAAGVERASAFLLLVNEPAATARAIRAVREAAPRVFLVARARLVADADLLRAAGADVAVSEEFEASVEVLARVLRHAGIPRNLIGARVEEARLAERLRRAAGSPPMARVEVPDLSHSILTVPYEVEPGDWAAGRPLEAAGLGPGGGVEAVVLVRGGERVDPAPSERMRPGDVLHLCGPRDEVGRVFDLLRKGAAGTEGGDKTRPVP